MIRTALLAGILLVMLSIAYNRPGALPELARVAATKVEQQTRRAVEAVAEAAPVVAAVEPVVAATPIAEPAPVSVAAAPAVAPQPVVAVQAVPAAVIAPPVAAQPANMPVRLYPPVPVAQAATPAELPVVNVAPRPARAPFDVAVGTVHQETPVASVTEVGAEQPAPNYMSPRERSRELYRLAREMEEKFLDKLAR